MRVVSSNSKEEYFNTQIMASRRKFRFCKVSTGCVERFKEIISRSKKGRIKGPVLCLGTRNGREIDLFRIYLFGNRLLQLLVKLFERRQYAFSSRFPFAESIGRSTIDKIEEGSVVGVELNPDGKRKDVLIGSFDALPKEWESKFEVIYANTLDHAYDPRATASEWMRVVSPGGYIIIGHPGEEVNPTQINPVGNFRLDDIKTLFPGEMIYFNKFGNCFPEIMSLKPSK